LVIGGQEVGIAGFDSIIAKGLDHIKGSDKEQRDAILKELKAHNYVPEAAEKEYLQAVWAEFKQVRAKRLGQIEERFQGIPREEITWFPTVDYDLCSACGKCAEFCHREVYTFDDKPNVENPYRCVVSCTGCQKTCPEGAISFPTLVALREELKALKKKHGILT
jgi:NAD-dependent dihydropyrimidine dehydrogenase PreA subunit